MVDRTRQTASGGGVALRLFAALQLPAELAGPIAEHAAVVADRIDGARPTGEHQLHVTYAFLGDVAEELVPAVAGALDGAAQRIPGPTACTLGAPVALGGGRAIGYDATFDLHAMLDAARDEFLDAVRAYAPRLDARPWHPHVTAVRTSTETAGHDVLAALREEPLLGTCVLPELRLYASLPAPGGRVHKVLHVAPLGTSVASR